MAIKLTSIKVIINIVQKKIQRGDNKKNHFTVINNFTFDKMTKIISENIH